ncbi:leucine-rich repeat and coiled-coil domain-containing protein 1-like isoform X2 [Octopus bimaculoides]|uniref:leucine-rich repeat and coiled-coil domain-containing protein 1-like isoform X2 n=1 Tax=Octopus bimaculoides TaxID=37653 RepID=UPI0022E36EF7|nr:leucine-rich repeat and coiled-coil domain-containing protein 1-like isoform X2 [Octopus bimaculoides]
MSLVNFFNDFTDSNRRPTTVSTLTDLDIAAHSAAVNYTRWERVPRKHSTLTTICVQPNLTGTNQPVLYPRTKTQELESGKKKGESQKEKLLELKLKFADQSLKNMLEQEKHQLAIGVRLREEIKSYERNCWENASCSLRKFQRLETGIIKIQRNFAKDIELEKKLLEEVKMKREFQIRGIQNELYQLDCLVEQHNNEYKKLLNYMHQEYPIKELIISGLERDIAELKMANEKEQKTVEQLLACEIMKYKQQWNKDENDLTKAICEKSLEMMPTDFEEILKENRILQKEINLLSKEQHQCTKTIQDLTSKMKYLPQSDTTSLRRQMFPEVFSPKTKCRPDFDIKLDISV